MVINQWRFTIKVADRMLPAEWSQKKAVWDEWERECSEFAERMGIRRVSFMHHVDLASPQLPAIIDQIQAWTDEGRAYAGIGELIEPMDGMPLDPDGRDWYQLNPPFQLLVDYGPDHPHGPEPYRGKFDSSEMAPDRHICDLPNPFAYSARVGDASLPSYICVSEKFVEVVRRHQLKGLEFFYIEDTAQRVGQQWFILAQQHSLGRGLDHPWVDPAEYYRRQREGESRAQDASSEPDVFQRAMARFGLSKPDPVLAGMPRDLRFGIHNFDNACRRPGGGCDDPMLDRIFRLYDRPTREALGWGAQNVDLRFLSPRRVLRDFLPDADFAYHGRFHWTESGMGSSLFISPRAAKVLIESGVLSMENLENLSRVKVVDSPPPGVPSLDHLGPAPPAPHLHPELLGILRAESAEALRRHQANPRPPFEPDLARALRLLDELRQASPEYFGSGASEEDLCQAERALGFPIPAPWRRVMLYGKFSFTRIEFLSPSEMVEETKSYRELFEGCNGQPPLGRWLAIALKGNGDCYVLDTARPQTPDGDCPVLLINHELDYHFETEWPTIGQFIEYYAARDL